MIQSAGEGEQGAAAQMAQEFLSEDLPESMFGAPKAGAGMWASCVRLMHPTEGKTLQLVGTGWPADQVMMGLAFFSAVLGICPVSL